MSLRGQLIIVACSVLFSSASAVAQKVRVYVTPPSPSTCPGVTEQIQFSLEEQLRSSADLDLIDSGISPDFHVSVSMICGDERSGFPDTMFFVITEPVARALNIHSVDSTFRRELTSSSLTYAQQDSVLQSIDREGTKLEVFRYVNCFQAPIATNIADRKEKLLLLSKTVAEDVKKFISDTRSKTFSVSSARGSEPLGTTVRNRSTTSVLILLGNGSSVTQRILRPGYKSLSGDMILAVKTSNSTLGAGAGWWQLAQDSVAVVYDNARGLPNLDAEGARHVDNGFYGNITTVPDNYGVPVN